MVSHDCNVSPHYNVDTCTMLILYGSCWTVYMLIVIFQLGMTHPKSYHLPVQFCSPQSHFPTNSYQTWQDCSFLPTGRKELVQLVSMDTGGIGIHSEGKQPDTGIPGRNGNVQSSQLTLLSCPVLSWPPGFPSTQWCSTLVHSTTVQYSTVYLLMISCLYMKSTHYVQTSQTNLHIFSLHMSLSDEPFR